MIPWTEKYRPRNLNELAGHFEAKQKALDFIKNFKSQKKRALLIYGPAGSGKTTLAHVFASELSFEIIELNASDLRNKKQIQDVMGQAAKQQSLFRKSKIILVDELEGVSGTKDRGGLQELIRLIQGTAYPILLTANDAWQTKLRPLRSKVQLLELKALDKKNLVFVLSKISKKEKLKISKDAIEILASMVQGDARAAINDLQTLSFLASNKPNKEITKKHVTELYSIGREKDENIFSALRLIFKSKNALNVFDQVKNMSYDDFFLWLDENIPIEYHGNELAKAYKMLSKADVFRGRIRRQQHWRFLSYIMQLLAQGIACVKKESKDGFTSYKPPSRILKIWLVKQKQAKKHSIAKKLAKKTHISKKKAYQELSFLQIAFKNTKTKEREKFASELKLEPEEIEWLTR